MKVVDIAEETFRELGELSTISVPAMLRLHVLED